MLISGTSVGVGAGSMLVVAVGMNSVGGKISAQIYGDAVDDEEEEVRPTIG